MSNERTVSINVPMPESLKDQVIAKATAENVGTATLVRRIIINYLADMRVGRPKNDDKLS